MLFWLRLLAATDFAKLSWPFAPLEYFSPLRYNENIRFVFGIVLWGIASLPIAVAYWLLVEFNILTNYTLGSGVTYGFLLWVLTTVLIFKVVGLGFAGLKYGKMLWLESLVGWLLFGFIFGLLIS